MNKPITMAIKETKTNLIRVCNESGLSLVILDLILQGLYSEIHALVEKQTETDEETYMAALLNQRVATTDKDEETKIASENVNE